jgi:hypothetical protein
MKGGWFILLHTGDSHTHLPITIHINTVLVSNDGIIR